MKKYTIYLLVALAAVAIIVNFSAFRTADTAKTNGPGYILVEIYEIPSYKDKGVHIHYGNNKTEVVPFKEFIATNHDENGDIIISTINKLVDQGYVIEHTTSGLANGGMITKLFLKKP
jgi:hypothetical protein